jgi:hypothetical protein
MDCTINYRIKANGTISSKGSTPIEDVPEFVKNATMSFRKWCLVRKDMKNFMNQYLDQFPHIHRKPRIHNGDTITILRSEYFGMKDTIAKQNKIIAAQAARIDEQDKIIAAQAAQIAVLTQQVQTLMQRVESLEAEVKELRHTVKRYYDLYGPLPPEL